MGYIDQRITYSNSFKGFTSPLSSISFISSSTSGFWKYFTVNLIYNDHDVVTRSLFQGLLKFCTKCLQEEISVKKYKNFRTLSRKNHITSFYIDWSWLYLTDRGSRRSIEWTYLSYLNILHILSQDIFTLLIRLLFSCVFPLKWVRVSKLIHPLKYKIKNYLIIIVVFILHIYLTEPLLQRLPLEGNHLLESRSTNDWPRETSFATEVSYCVNSSSNTSTPSLHRT